MLTNSVEKSLDRLHIILVEHLKKSQKNYKVAENCCLVNFD